MGNNKVFSGYTASALALVFVLTALPGVAQAASVSLSGPYGGCEEFTLTVTFDQPVTGFDEGDLVLVNAAAGLATALTDTVYQVPVTATGNAVMIEVPENVVLENNTASNLFEYFVRPSAEKVTGGTYTTTYKFNEPVTDFSVDDFRLSAGMVVALDGGPEVFDVTIALPAKSTGTLTIDVPAGAVKDLCGNLSLAAPQRCIPFGEEETQPQDAPESTPAVSLGSTLKQAPAARPIDPKAPGVPVTGGAGLLALCAAIAGAGAYSARRRK